MKDPEKWTKGEFNIIGHTAGAKEASVTAASVGTDMTSQHYDLIVLDDIANRELSATEDQRRKVFKFYTDCQDLLEPNGKMVIIGTRWHFADIYSKLIEQNKKKHNFAFIVDEPMMKHPKYSRRDFKQMLDEPGTEFLFPEKFDRKEAKKLYMEKMAEAGGTLEFSSQQMNFPCSDENSAFRFEDLRFIHEKDVPRSATIYQTIDPAGAEHITSTQDDTAIVTTAIDTDLSLYCVDCWADRTTLSGLFAKVDAQSKKYPQARKIGIERNFNASNAMMIKEMFPHLMNRLVTYRASNMMSKEARIMSLQPYVSNGKFYFVEHDDGEEYAIGDKVVKLHVGQYKLLTQMIDFGNTEHDDAIDAQAATLEFIRKPKDVHKNNTYTWTPHNKLTGY